MYEAFMCFNLIFLSKQKLKQHEDPCLALVGSIYPVLVVTGHNHGLLCKRTPPFAKGVRGHASCFLSLLGHQRVFPVKVRDLFCLLFAIAFLWGGSKQHRGSSLCSIFTHRKTDNMWICLAVLKSACIALYISSTEANKHCHCTQEMFFMSTLTHRLTETECGKLPINGHRSHSLIWVSAFLIL